MKNFILDSTYKDISLINSNDDISIVSSHNLPYNAINRHSLDLNKTNTNYISHHNKNCKFNSFNIIDYL